MDLIHLSPGDNIVVLARSVSAGESIVVGGIITVLPCLLGLGHKLALKPIAAGEKIFKYGAAIGSATADIAPGEHIHLHNMKSDYLPTYTLEKGREFRAAS